jgi:hypothetical protein
MKVLYHHTTLREKVRLITEAKNHRIIVLEDMVCTPHVDDDEV